MEKIDYQGYLLSLSDRGIALRFNGMTRTAAERCMDPSYSAHSNVLLNAVGTLNIHEASVEADSLRYLH